MNIYTSRMKINNFISVAVRPRKVPRPRAGRTSIKYGERPSGWLASKSGGWRR